MIFFKKQLKQIIEEHKSESGIHMWIMNLQTNQPLGKSACRPKRDIFIFICWCTALSLCLNLSYHASLPPHPLSLAQSS